MLRLINVCKSYKCGKNRIKVLDNINLDFKKNELVFILGKSGSGKSTLLNIIGGLLEIDSGKVMLDDKDIAKFNNNMLCNYRNNMIGLIFQDYHLIEYMSVLDNITLGQTVRDDSYNNVDLLLRKLGIYSKRKTKVNKLSGGEKQRVAIARAIINNPDIILADEPTGALDSFNSIKIMNILKEISRDKLVIVVSHDNLLASKYADRVINITDGKVCYYPISDDSCFGDVKKKRIRIFGLIKLAIKNLWLKKWRTFFTSFAISISFVSILLVLCLSKSFNDDISNLERNVVSAFPISIYNGEFEMVDSNLEKSDSMIINKNRDDYVHINKIDSSYLDYINKIDEINYIGYVYDISMPLVSDMYKILDNRYMKMLPSNSFIDSNYDILYGNGITSINEIVLKVDSNNNVSSELLDVFNINGNIEYESLIGRKLRLVLNDLYYVKDGRYYYINDGYENLYKNSTMELEVVGIVREKEIVDDFDYFYYDSNLIDYIIDNNSNSKIVLEQINSDYNVLGMDMDKEDLLSYLGYETLPSGINIYVSSLSDKEVVLDKLDEYNNRNNKLIYVDTMMDAINILKNVINIITIVLILFSFISMLVSGLMIFILTNNRVMERVKEIGILRSLGARSIDISRLFDIENLIIGIISSLIGIILINFISVPLNIFMEMFLDEGIFRIYNDLVIISILFNIFIVMIFGLIPTKVAGKRKIVDCIKSN